MEEAPTMILTAELTPLTDGPRSTNPSMLAAGAELVTPLSLALGLGAETSTDDNDLWLARQRSITEDAERATVRHPQSPSSWARLAQAATASGDMETAAAAATEAIALQVEHPDSPSMIVAILTLASQGDFDAAEIALEGRPLDDSLALLSASLKAERSDWDGCLEVLQGVDTSSATALRGWVYLEKGEPQKALSQLRKSAVSFGEDAVTAVNMACAFAALGSSRKAVRAARQATGLAPHRRDISLTLVAHLIASDSLEEALGELARIEKVDGADLETALLDGLVNWQLGRTEHAIRNLKRARGRSLPPAGSIVMDDVNAVMVALEYEQGLRSRTEVVDELSRLVTRSPEPSVRVAVLASRLMTASELRSFVPELLSGPFCEVDDERLWELRYRVERANGDILNASVSVRNWARANPSDPLAQAEVIMMIAMAEGDYDAAADTATHALRIHPRNKLVRNNSAFALALANRPSAARAALLDEPDDAAINSGTTGLVRIASGDLKGGYQGYRKAIEIATSEGRPALDEFCALVALYYRYALQHFGLEDRALAAGLTIDEVRPSSAVDNVAFSLLDWAIDVNDGPLRWFE